MASCRSGLVTWITPNEYSAYKAPSGRARIGMRLEPAAEACAACVACAASDVAMLDVPSS